MVQGSGYLRTGQNSLGRWYRAFQPLVRRYGFAQRPGRALKTAFDDMMAVLPVEIFDMQADAGMLCEGLEPFLEQLGVHFAQLGLRHFDPPDEIGPVGD